MKKTFAFMTGFFWLVTVVGIAAAQDPTEADLRAMESNFQAALENNPTNQTSTWVNPDTGATGSAVPVKTFESAYGQPCREFRQTIIIGGREQEGYGTACRQPDGSWRIVAPDQLQANPASTTGSRVYTSETRVYNQYYPDPRPVYVPSRPVRYYDPWYYDPWYGYPAYYPWPFSVSLGYVKYSGGHKHGGHRHYRGHRGHGSHWGHKGGHGGRHWRGGREGHHGGHKGSWGRGGGRHSRR